jgi:hypothetical protein
MNENLTKTASEIEEYLAARGLAVFYGEERDADETRTIHWDSLRRPDYRPFVAAAEAAGVKLINVFVNEFRGETVEVVSERLQDLPRDQRREAEQKLRELRQYSGVVCQIELSFDLGQRVYLFELRTSWFDELNDLLHDIDDADEDDDEPSLGTGYFSKN